MVRKLFCNGIQIDVQFITWSEYSIKIDGDDIVAIYNSQGGMCITEKSAMKILDLLEETPVCIECKRPIGIFGDDHACLNKTCETGKKQRESIREAHFNL